MLENSTLNGQHEILMASPSWLQHAQNLSSQLPSPTIALLIGILVALPLFTSYNPLNRKRRYPTINAKSWDPWGQKAKADYTKNAMSLIREGFEKFHGPFYLLTDIGPTLILPPALIDVVSKEEALSFDEYNRKFFLSRFNTFKHFRNLNDGNEGLAHAINKGLTRSLPKFTGTLSEEMASCLEDSWGDCADWHEVQLKPDVLQWVTRLSTRIFVGPQLSADAEWIRISQEYAVGAFQAVQDVKSWPRPLQWPAERWLKSCRKMRADYAKAQDIITPLVTARKEEHSRAAIEGRVPNVPDDSLEWFRTAALSKDRTYEPVDSQIGLSLAAIHTTSDLLAQAIINLTKHPEVVEALREEAIQVLSKYGWQKLALTEVRLLDSFLKETQRMKPILLTVRRVVARKDVVLPGGVVIPKGELAAVSADNMWSSAVYDEPHTFDAARFVKRREKSEQRNNSLLISTSKDMLAFSHGKHSCPGRFFAANEVKIAMLHLLLKYDFMVDESRAADWLAVGEQLLANPFAKISIRRRKAEIDLDALAAPAKEH